VRTVVADGECHLIECAVAADGSAPALEFLNQLRKGVRETYPVDIDSDAQVQAYGIILARCEYLARYGEFASRNRKHYNQLWDGIWELKHEELRLSFFDTAGDGTYSPKIAESDYWGNAPRLPIFDEFIRLGRGFPKPRTMRWTPEAEIRFALRLREEDLEHDKADLAY